MTTTTTTTSTAVTLPNSGNPYLHTTPAPPPPTSSATHALHTLGRKFDSAARKTESFAANLYTHLRTGPGILDVAATRIDQAVRTLADGGCDAVFRREFGGLLPGEKLKDTFACYLSTTTGPVMGTMYVSNRRVGFRSDYPMWTGVEWVYYKVVLMKEQIMAVNPSANVRNHAEKYVQILTKDGHEFWFMGFILYDQALKKLNKLIYNHCK